MASRVPQPEGVLTRSMRRAAQLAETQQEIIPEPEHVTTATDTRPSSSTSDYALAAYAMRANPQPEHQPETAAVTQEPRTVTSNRSGMNSEIYDEANDNAMYFTPNPAAYRYNTVAEDNIAQQPLGSVAGIQNQQHQSQQPYIAPAVDMTNRQSYINMQQPSQSPAARMINIQQNTGANLNAAPQSTCMPPTEYLSNLIKPLEYVISLRFRVYQINLTRQQWRNWLNRVTNAVSTVTGLTPSDIPDDAANAEAFGLMNVEFQQLLIDIKYDANLAQERENYFWGTYSASNIQQFTRGFSTTSNTPQSARPRGPTAAPFVQNVPQVHTNIPPVNTTTQHNQPPTQARVSSATNQTTSAVLSITTPRVKNLIQELENKLARMQILQERMEHNMYDDRRPPAAHTSHQVYGVNSSAQPYATAAATANYNPHPTQRGDTISNLTSPPPGVNLYYNVAFDPRTTRPGIQQNVQPSLVYNHNQQQPTYTHMANPDQHNYGQPNQVYTPTAVTQANTTNEQHQRPPPPPRAKQPMARRYDHDTAAIVSDLNYDDETNANMPTNQPQQYNYEEDSAPPLPPPEPYINQANTSQTTLNPINSAAAKFEMDRFRWLAEMRKLFKDSCAPLSKGGSIQITLSNLQEQWNTIATDPYYKLKETDEKPFCSILTAALDESRREACRQEPGIEGAREVSVLISNLQNKFKPNTTASRNELSDLGVKPKTITGRQWLTTKIVKIYNKYNVPFPTTRDGLNPILETLGSDYIRLLETKWDTKIGDKESGITYQEVEHVFDETDNSITRNKVATRQEEFHKYSYSKQQRWSDQSVQRSTAFATGKDATKSNPTSSPVRNNTTTTGTTFRPKNEARSNFVQRKPGYNANMLEIEEERMDEPDAEDYNPDTPTNDEEEDCSPEAYDEEDEYEDDVEMCVSEVKTKPLLSSIFRWEGVDGPIECQINDLVKTRSNSKTKGNAAKPPLETKTKPRKPETWTGSASQQERQAIIEKYQSLTRQRQAQQAASNPPATTTHTPAEPTPPTVTNSEPVSSNLPPLATPTKVPSPETTEEPRTAAAKPARRGRPPKQQQQQQHATNSNVSNSSATVPLQTTVLPSSVLNKIDEVSRHFSVSKSSAAVRLAAANVHFNLLQMLEFYRNQHSQKLLTGLYELFIQAGIYKEPTNAHSVNSMELNGDNQELEMLADDEPTMDNSSSNDASNPVATLHALLGVMLTEARGKPTRRLGPTPTAPSKLSSSTTKPTQLPRSYPTGFNSNTSANNSVVSTEVPTGILYPAKVKPGVSYSAAAKKPVSKLKIGNTSLPRLQWKLSRQYDSATYQGVIDSGATVSAIDAKWAVDHLQEFLQGGATLLDIQPLSITGFSGHGVEVTQMLRGVKLHIGVGVYPVNLYLVPGLGTNKTMLLGADFQYQYNLHIEWQQNTIWLGVPEVVKGVSRSQLREHGLSKGYQCVKLILSRHYHQVLVEKETKHTATPTQ